jgi:excisionase family DNA binding protein
MQQPLLNSDDVAKILHVSRSFAYLLMKRGDIPAVRVGTAVRVRPEDLERYINNNAMQGDIPVQSLSDGD